MSGGLSRRGFLEKSAGLAGLAAAGAFRGPLILAGEAPGPAKLRCAVVGANGQGGASVGAALGERVVALVDVDDNRLAQKMKEVEAKQPGSPVKGYFDYRRMYDEMAREIDVVFVATPDHNHYPASRMAIELGKHVFCEKPLTHDLSQARAIAEAAKAKHVATQMGNQGHSGDGYRRLCEYIWAGAIGNVTETHSWIGMVNGGTGGRPPSKPVPAGLHWDQWLGPAAFRDFHDGVHPGSWRGWWAFGGGSVGDWGCHQMDGVFWALKLGEAKTCTLDCLEQFGGSDERYPIGSHLCWTYPARGAMPPVKVHWYDGQHKNPDPNARDKNGRPIETVRNAPPMAAEFEKRYNRTFDTSFEGGGTIYIGDKGVMYTYNYGGSPRILPEEVHKAFPVPKDTLPRIRGGHFGDFLRACRGGEPASADFSYAGPLTEFVLLGHLALRAGVGNSVEWDSEKLAVTNRPELNRWVKPEYREGWRV